MKTRNVLSFFLILVFNIAKAQNDTSVTREPYVAPNSVIETIWGHKIKDEFRNLEDLKDTTILNWYRKNHEHAQEALSVLKHTDTLFQLISGPKNKAPYRIRWFRQISEENHIYLKKRLDEKSYRLYHFNAKDSIETLLFDPTTFRPESKEAYTVNYIQPSWDGRYVAVSLVKKGQEIASLVIVDVKAAKPLPYTVENCWPEEFGGIQWLPDNTGFAYLHFPVVDNKNPEFKKNTSAVLHHLGEDPKDFTVLFSEEKYPELFQHEKGYPIISIDSGKADYLMAFISASSKYQTAFFAPIRDIEKPKIDWKPLYTNKDKIVIGPILHGKELIYKTAKEHSNYQLASVTLPNPDFSNPKILVASDEEEVIEDFDLTSEGLFYYTYTNGVTAKLYFRGYKGDIRPVTTPIDAGYISLAPLGPDSPKIWMYMDGWAAPYERYYFDHTSFTFEKQNLTPVTTNPLFDNITIEEVEVIAHDGVKIPLSIIYDKNFVFNSSNSAFIQGYGAYGSSVNPVYSNRLLSWVALGGVYCVAHVRGGGEKGEDWRLGGFKTNKPNSWKDLISCSEYLINRKFTRKGKIAIFGGSAGGILVGGAANERPDLFGAVIAQVPMMNPFRNEKGLSRNSNKEYGTVKDSVEAMALMRMDPYHNIKKAPYPATLVVAGIEDARVAPWFSGKYIAKLRTYNTSSNPIVYNIEFDGGHRRNTATRRYKDWATFFSFAFWQTGHPDFQPD